MKTIHDFIFCDGVLTPQTVFYLVKVGSSSADRHAFSYVAKLARAPDFYFKKHTAETTQFLEKCAASVFSVSDIATSIKLQRRVVVDIAWLASFLRKNPPALLNSLKIAPPVNKVNT